MSNNEYTTTNNEYTTTNNEQENNIINQNNIVDINEYKITIRDKIESLSECEQKEIFRIFRKYDIEYSENNNGIFINLINVKNSILNEVDEYIKHLLVIEKEINNIENQKNEIKNSFSLNNNI